MGSIFRLNFLSLILSLSILVFANSAFAEEETKANSTNVKTTEKVVITGSRNERVLSNAPVKTEVVEKDVIERNHLTDLSQVLDNIPGITLQGLTARMGQSAVIQGLGDDHVLVLIDGIPQLQTSSNGFDLTQLSVNDIERVEVIKGGSSSLYGSQAMGGVINVLTKRPTDKLTYFVDVRSNVQTKGAIDQSPTMPNVLNATASGKVKDLFNYKFSYGYRHQDSIDLDPTSIILDMGGFKRHNASAYATHKISNKSNVYLDYRFTTEKLDSLVTQMSNNGFLPTNRDSITQSQSVTLGLNTKVLNDSNLKIHGHYTHISDELTFDDLTTPYMDNLKSSDLNTVMFESQLDTMLIKDQITTLGFLYRYQFLDQINADGTASGQTSTSDVDRKNMYSIESYGQHSYAKNNFELTSGLRGQYDSGFGGNFSPSVNSIYSPELLKNHKVNFRSSIGTGYKVPALKERFFFMDHRAIGNYILMGSEDLIPERSVSFQAGVELIKSDDYSFHINGFVNNVRDMIGTDMQPSNDGTIIMVYKNFGEVLSQGVEVATRVYIGNNISLEQDLTYTRVTDQNTDLTVPLRPQTAYKMRLRYKPNKDIDLIGLLRYQSDMYVDEDNTEISPASTVFDLSMNYKYNRQLILYAGVDNVFDQTRVPAQDGALLTMDMRSVIGRQFHLGVNFREL